MEIQDLIQEVIKKIPKDFPAMEKSFHEAMSGEEFHSYFNSDWDEDQPAFSEDIMLELLEYYIELFVASGADFTDFLFICPVLDSENEIAIYWLHGQGENSINGFLHLKKDDEQSFSYDFFAGPINSMSSKIRGEGVNQDFAPARDFFMYISQIHEPQ